MKNNFRLLVVALGIISVTPVIAQKDNVGIGTTKPDQSAVLDVSSSNKGLLMPRMSLQQRSSIQNPAQGLVIYQTDFLSGFYFYDGKEWKGMTSANSTASTEATNGTVNFVAKFTGASTIDNSQIFDNGTNVGVGTSTPTPGAKLDVAGGIRSSSYLYLDNAATSKGVGFRNSGVDRWSFQTDGAGEDLFLYRYDNAGAFAGTQLTFNRASGLTTFGNSVVFGGNIISNGFINLNNATSQKGIFYQVSGLSRWVQQTDGANSDFYLYRYDNAGAYVGAAMKIDRASGETKFGGSVKVQTVTGHLAVGDFDGAGLTTPAGYRLIVQDGILTEKIKVALKTSAADWADYVFEPSYKLIPLEKVEEFVKENKHLPNVPSAEDMVNSGLDVAKTSAKLMEKIEELTLYMIEMNKEIKALKAENERLKK